MSHIIIQPSTGLMLQQIKHVKGQVLIHCTRRYHKAMKFASEHAANSELSFDMKHQGWIAKRLKQYDDH